MPEFSFIHAADLHLDSPFVGLANLPDSNHKIVETLRQATFRAFDNLIGLCLHKKVDFLLVAGDVYDGADRSLQAQLRFRDGLQKLDAAGIQTFIVHGNHDPLDGWSHSLTFPASVHTFAAEAGSIVFQKEDVPVARIHGISYPSSNINEDFGRELARQGNERFQIGLFHCNVGGDANHANYAPRTITELVASKLDYWALGHVHETAVLREANPFIGYPGNTQGRHIREQGKRGCFHVSVDSEGRMQSTPEFLETDVVRWMVSEVDITDIADMDELIGRLEQEMDELSQQAAVRPVLARFTLHGRGVVHGDLTRANAANELLEALQNKGATQSSFIWVERLKVRTRSTVDIAARREGQDFVGDLLTMIHDLRESPQLQEQISGALAELYDHARAGRLLDMPDGDALLALIDEAESRCVDLFIEDDT